MSHPGDAMADLPVQKIVGLTLLQAAFFFFAGLGMWAWTERELLAFVTFQTSELVLGLLIAGGMIAFGYVLFRAFPRFGEKLVRDQVRQFAFLKNPMPPLAIVLIAAGAGIGEEALFRGGILTLLDHYGPFPVALLVSSGVFTVIHFAKPAVAALIFAIGVFFGLTYWTSGSLLAVMIGHWVYDIWALWFIQKEMHRLDVFDDGSTAPNQALEITGENQ